MTHLVYMDVDGVVADERHRQHHILGSQLPDWTAYFGEMWADTVWPDGKRLFDELAEVKNVEIEFLTGRRIDMFSITARWLEVNGFGLRPITMKEHGMVGRLAKFKTDVMLAEWATGDWESITVYDDDMRVIDAVRKLAHPHLFASHCAWHTKPHRMMQAAIA